MVLFYGFMMLALAFRVEWHGGTNVKGHMYVFCSEASSQVDWDEQENPSI